MVVPGRSIGVLREDWNLSPIVRDLALNAVDEAIPVHLRLLVAVADSLQVLLGVVLEQAIRRVQEVWAIELAPPVLALRSRRVRL